MLFLEFKEDCAGIRANNMVAKASARKPEKRVEEGIEAPNGKHVETVFEAFVEHQRKAISEAFKALESLLPVAVKEHGEAALKEMVEGYRTLFNTAIDEIVDTIEKVKVGADKNVDQAIETVEKIKME